MLMTQLQFDKLSKEAQNEYLYFFSAWHEAKAEKEAIEFTEKVKARFNSGLSGVERAGVEPDMTGHHKYEMLVEDVEDYEKRLKKILAKLED